MPTNETRRDLLNQIRSSGYPGSVTEVFQAADQGIDLVAQFVQQQEQQQMQVAQTPQEQEVGLREEHARGNTQASMAFPDVQPNQSFNTVGMEAPIDIQKVDDQGHLVESYKNVPPGIQDLPTGPYEGTIIESPAAYQKGGMRGMMKSKIGYESQFGNNPAINRMLAPTDESYKFTKEDAEIYNNPNLVGSTGTHYMGSWDKYAVPQIQDIGGKLDLTGPRKDEAIKFHGPRAVEDATYFAEHYKDVAPAFQKQKGGFNLGAELSPEIVPGNFCGSITGCGQGRSPFSVIPSIEASYNTNSKNINTGYGGGIGFNTSPSSGGFESILSYKRRNAFDTQGYDAVTPIGKGTDNISLSLGKGRRGRSSNVSWRSDSAPYRYGINAEYDLTNKKLSNIGLYGQYHKFKGSLGYNPTTKGVSVGAGFKFQKGGWKNFEKSKVGKFIDARGLRQEKDFWMQQFGYEPGKEEKDALLDAASIFNPGPDFAHAATKYHEGKYTDAGLYAGFGILPFSAGPLVKGAKSHIINPIKKFFGKNKFKSDINWGAWNKSIPKNKKLIKEYNLIEKTAKENGTWMRNADGSPFKGSPEQFVQQNSKNFKKAFGNSKLVNPDGSPMVVYHGSGKKFDTFNPRRVGEGDAGYSGVGIYTTPSKTTASSYSLSASAKPGDVAESTIYSFYGNTTNPITSSKLIDNVGGDIYPIGTDYDKLLKQRRNKDLPLDLFNFNRPGTKSGLSKFDAAIKNQQRGITDKRNIQNAWEIVFPDGKQLKSTVGNSGMFDLTNPNIYKEKGGFINKYKSKLKNWWKGEEPSFKEDYSSWEEGAKANPQSELWKGKPNPYAKFSQPVMSPIDYLIGATTVMPAKLFSRLTALDLAVNPFMGLKNVGKKSIKKGADYIGSSGALRTSGQSVNIDDIIAANKNLKTNNPVIYTHGTSSAALPGIVDQGGLVTRGGTTAMTGELSGLGNVRHINKAHLSVAPVTNSSLAVNYAKGSSGPRNYLSEYNKMIDDMASGKYAGAKDNILMGEGFEQNYKQLQYDRLNFWSKADPKTKLLLEENYPMVFGINPRNTAAGSRRYFDSIGNQIGSEAGIKGGVKLDEISNIYVPKARIDQTTSAFGKNLGDIKISSLEDFGKQSYSRYHPTLRKNYMKQLEDVLNIYKPGVRRVGKHGISKEGYESWMKNQIIPAKYNTELVEAPSNVYRAVSSWDKSLISNKNLALKNALNVNPGVYHHGSRYNVGMSTSPNKRTMENFFKYRRGKNTGYYRTERGINPRFKGVKKWDLSYNVNPDAKILNPRGYKTFMHKNIAGDLEGETIKRARLLREQGYDAIKKFPDSDELQWLDPTKKLELSNIKEIKNLQKGGLRNHMMDYLHTSGRDTSYVNTVMNAIGQHESKNNPNQVQVSGNETEGFYDGPGRGLFQFETGPKEGGNTAINRTANFLKHNTDKNIKDFPYLFKLYTKDNSLDFSKLSKQDQEGLFIGDKIFGGPERRDEFDAVTRNRTTPPSQEEVFIYWLRNHKGKVNGKNISELTEKEIDVERKKWNNRTKSTFKKRKGGYRSKVFW